MSLAKDVKTTKEVRQEVINWLPEMSLSSPIDVISTSTWTASHGLTVDSNSKTNSTTTAVISGGQLGQYCELVNTVVTTAGYTYTKTIIMEITPT